MAIAAITDRLSILLRAACCIAALSTLGGCGNAMPFDAWVKRYNSNVDRAQNDLLLTNVVRAGKHMPLLFTGVQVVRGSGQVTSGVGVGNTSTYQTTSQFGTATIAGWMNAFTPTATLSATDGFNFDVSILDTSEFYKGLLTPVTPDTFGFYLGQGIPTEMLLNLLVERITITENGQTRNYINDPAGARYEAFRTVLAHMLQLGLTTEVVSTELPVGPVLTPTEAGDVKNLVAAATAGLIPKPTPHGGFQLVKLTKAARFCFMASKPGLPVLPQASLCKASPARHGGHVAPAGPRPPSGDETLEFEKAAMTIQLRSTRSVFSYLGRLVIQQTEDGQPALEMQTPEVQEFAPRGTGMALFRVVRGSGGDSLATTDYRGGSYSIPAGQQGVSATVLSIVTQLLSLSKSVNSVPSTGTVVVAN
jgi:hypothetical protein